MDMLARIAEIVSKDTVGGHSCTFITFEDFLRLAAGSFGI